MSNERDHVRRSDFVAIPPADRLQSALEIAGAIVGGAIGATVEAVFTLTPAQLKAAMPSATMANIDRFVRPINMAFRNYGIVLPAQRAAFLANVSVECGQLNKLVEGLSYSAQRLTQVWPRRFPSLKDAKPYAHNAESLANKTYGGRLGNGDEESGDGYRYRGRGLLQVTGRENYRKAGFEHRPEALEDPNIAADTAGRFWHAHGLNERTRRVLTRAEFNAIVEIINGGQNGSTERWTAYGLALKALTPRPAR